MRVQVYGTGCRKCDALAANVEAAAGALGIEVEIERVKSVPEITAAGVLLTPALGIEGRLRSSGRILAVDEIEDMLREERDG